MGALLLWSLAILVVSGIVTPEAAVVALVILIVAVLLFALEQSDIRGMVQRVNKFSVAGANVELSPAALPDSAAAARDIVDQEEGGAGDTEEDRVEDAAAQSVADQLLDLRLSLDRKLTYLAKHVLADVVDGREQPTFLTIGSLSYDKFLSDAQARTLVRLLMVSNAEVAGPRGRQFLDDASRIVRNLRATVFQQLVGKVLRECGWKQVNVISKPGRRIMVVNRDDRELRVVPVWAVGGSRREVDRAQQRVLPEEGPVTLIVVPNQSSAGFLSEPRVVKVKDLPSVLSE